MNCKFCNSDNCTVKKKIQSEHNQQLYDLYFCHACRSCFFNDKQYSTSFKELYDRISASGEYLTNDFVPSRKWYKQVSIIKKLLSKSPRSVLDVGCRTGDFLLHFGKETECEGVEISDYYAGIGRQRGLTIHNNFLENVVFKRKYDVVSAYAIMEHLVDPLKFIDKLNQIVNRDGLLVILIPTYQCLKRKFLDFLGKRWHMYSPPEHLNFYSRDFLDRFLSEKGFYLVKRSYTSGGMIKLFPNLPILNKIGSKLIELSDNSFLNRLPIFDHMYSYYILKY